MAFPDRAKYSIPIPLEIRTISVKMSFESCLLEDPLACGHIFGHGNAYADGNQAKIYNDLHRRPPFSIHGLFSGRLP
jgi:hypothetical protein